MRPGRIRPVEAPHLDRLRSEFPAEAGFEIPIRARPAAEYIQTQRPVFREGVAGDVRFLEQGDSGDATTGELVPDGVPDGVEIHFVDEAREEIAESRGVRD
jgi:hypothetical protein